MEIISIPILLRGICVGDSNTTYWQSVPIAIDTLVNSAYNLNIKGYIRFHHKVHKNGFCDGNVFLKSWSWVTSDYLDSSLFTRGGLKSTVWLPSILLDKTLQLNDQTSSLTRFYTGLIL